MIVQLAADLSVNRLVTLADIPDHAAQVGGQLRVVVEVDLFVVVAQPGVGALHLGIVGQAEGVAVHFLLVARKVDVGVVPHAVALVVAGAEVQLQVLAVVNQPDQVGHQRPVLPLFAGMGAVVGGHAGFPRSLVTAVEYQVAEQAILDQRPGGIDRAVVNVATLAGGRVLVAVAQRAFGLVAGAAQDHVDHPAHGVGAIQRGHRPTDHFDTFYRAQGDGRQVEVVGVVAGQGVARVDPAAVDQQQGVVGVQATHLDLVAAVGGRRGDADAGHFGNRFGKVQRLHLL
ncbi:hypothetical protein D3C78_1152250 [compost metagenome]